MRVILMTMVFCSFFSMAATADDKKLDSWDGFNNPFRIDKNFEDRFQYLPLFGDTSKSGFGWPAYYWANNKGGIAQRWSSNNPQNFKYESPSLYTLKMMSESQINELSPAEKFDILNGRYDYPTVEKVWGQTRKGAKEWNGICHGASPAGLNHKEPKLKVLTNQDQVKITFYSSDIKALAAYYYAKISDTSVTQIGKRCFASHFNPFKGKGCSDVHPASMHIIMTNRLGLTSKGYIADIDRLKQVWNHVAVKFDAKVISSVNIEKNPSHKMVHILSKVSYTGGVDPSMNAILGTKNEKWDIREYEYKLELDANGKIVGGEWISDERPDFIWVKDKEVFDDAYYGKVSELL